MTDSASPTTSVRSGFAKLAGSVATIAGLWCLITVPFADSRLANWGNAAWGLLGIPASSDFITATSLLVIGSLLRRRMWFGWVVASVLELLWVLFAGYVAIVGLSHWSKLGANVGLTRFMTVWITACTLMAVVVLALLVQHRRGFPARLRKGSWAITLGVLAAGLSVAFAIVFSLSMAFPGRLPGLAERATWSALAVIGFGRIDGPGALHGPFWLGVLAGILGGLALLVAILAFIRSARSRQFLDGADELRVRELLSKYGEDDSLGYFATRRDKSIIFAPDGRAAITYRVVASVSLASADPIGERDSWPAAIEAWLLDARTHGWYPAALSASVNGAEAYVDAGLSAIRLGDEAVVQVDAFHLSSPEMRAVKRAVTHCTKAGYTVQVRRHGELTDQELREINQLADNWRGDEPDRGFSMALNRIGDRADDGMVTVTAHDEQGVIRGLLGFVPWGRRGLSLDVMRRDPVASNGVNEFMIATLIERADDLGVRRISLNFAVFRSIFANAEHVGAGPLVRLADGVLGFASRFWQLETLYRSNDKYLPAWLPRYLCFDSAFSLLRVAIAAGMAEGFVPSPRPNAQPNAADMVVPDASGTQPFLTALDEQTERLRTIAPPERRLNALQKSRFAKLDLLRASGMDPWPVSVPRDSTLASVWEAHARLRPGGRTGAMVRVTGRVRALRDFGGLVFAVLEEDGVRLQVMLGAERVPSDSLLLWRRAVDTGDIVAVQGEVRASDAGELSVYVHDWQMASKCLNPIPGLRQDFTDPDARVRQRHLDMIVNHDSLELLQARSRAVAAFRDGFTARGFAEVETPMLHTVHGGASARPFRTHINAYHQDLSLRIAPELYLKRLAVGGMGRIFELNRNFRNEGADATHNPEFTAVEAYQAWADYHDMRLLTRDLILEVATRVHGEPVAVRPLPEGGVERVRLDVEWPVVAVHDAVSQATGVALTSGSTLEEVAAVCRSHNVAVPDTATAGQLVLELYEELVEGQTTMPVFYTDFPLETSPLTRTHRSDPRLAERWDLVAFGAELGTAYSELVDPIDQRNRLTTQSMKAAAGDLEAMEIDEQFLSAMEYAMPPTGGLGIGVDRVVMLLCGVNIRATLAFPFVRG